MRLSLNQPGLIKQMLDYKLIILWFGLKYECTVSCRYGCTQIG